MSHAGKPPPTDPDADLFDDDFVPDTVELPVDGTLDLHTFSPAEVKELVPDYLGVCLEKGIYELRIIHGKGTGTLRRLVESVLQKDPRVASFRLGGQGAGGWGATLVVLHRP